MLTDRLKKRLTKDRPMTSITLRIPVDVVDSMKEIAPQRGFSGISVAAQIIYQRRFAPGRSAIFRRAYRPPDRSAEKHGVSEKVIEEAERDLSAA